MSKNDSQLQPVAASARQPNVVKEPDADQVETALTLHNMRLSGEHPAPNADFPIVGIGSSAGGLEALVQLLHALPPDTGLSFVCVQHLDALHKSHLPDILSRETSIPVEEVKHGVRVQPNHIYVMPEGMDLEIKGEVLQLIPREARPAPHMPIDRFFRSLATYHGSRAIGVILSGTASDGTFGLKTIKAEGGITFAQDPETAKYDGMPRSAIAAGSVDLILSCEQIGKTLATLAQNKYVLAPASIPDEELEAGSPASFSQILGAVRRITGIDFSYYKSGTVKRRILRRMRLHGLATLEDYVGLLKADPDEVRALHEDMLINVTEFFRDPEVFDILTSTIFPRLMKFWSRENPVRIWVPGCSMGEEAYSIAICLLEFLSTAAEDIPIQIFASDISDRALDRARRGLYPASIRRSVSSERLRKFFSKVDSGYQISKQVREICIFAKQNLIKDPPFSRLDLISCRNVLMKRRPPLQKRVIPLFHYALKPNGYLLLGSSETIGAYSDYFTLMDRKHKIYLRNQIPARLPLSFPSPAPEPQPAPDFRPSSRDSRDGDLQKEADRIILSRFTPAGIVVDENLDILHFRGHTSAYLEPGSGAASLNLVKMAREGLLSGIRAAVRRSKKEGVPIRQKGLHVKSKSGLQKVDIEVVPLRKGTGAPQAFLIVFEDASRAIPEPPVHGRDARQRREARASARESAELREDLASTKEYLQSVIEEQEATTEELRSANEEIQSTNEELQSTNEELETSKEELLSANEELSTVNNELQSRNLQLGQMTNDLLNVLSNVNIPIVILDHDLRIRRFTPASMPVLKLISGDIGRPITDIKLKLKIPHLETVLREVIQNLSPRALEVRDDDRHRYSVRIRPYRTEDNRIEGVVIVLMDLDPRRSEAEVHDALRQADRELHTQFVQHPELEKILLGSESSLRESR